MTQEKRQYRHGPLGALMDEYERAIRDLQELLHSLSADDYLRISNPASPDPDCLSVQTILHHVVRSGYNYAGHIRKALGVETQQHHLTEPSQSEAFRQLDEMFQYTLATLDGRWEMTDEELNAIVFKTHWSEYDIESMLEHAIVHLMRHRRQIHKLVGK